jgi:hypothetical protein
VEDVMLSSEEVLAQLLAFSDQCLLKIPNGW